MTTYYRALRRNHDDLVSWGPSPNAVLSPDPGAEYATSEPGEVLEGGKWPCRLFTVEPSDDVFLDDLEPHLAGCSKWAVTAEVKPWQALGPYGQDVVLLIEQVRELTTDQATQIADVDRAFRNVSRGIHGDGLAGDAWLYLRDRSDWLAASDAAEAVGRCAAEQNAWAAVWDAVTETILTVPGVRLPCSPTTPEECAQAVWGPARDATAAAAQALVVADLLPPEYLLRRMFAWGGIMRHPRTGQLWLAHCRELLGIPHYLDVA